MISIVLIATLNAWVHYGPNLKFNFVLLVLGGYIYIAWVLRVRSMKSGGLSEGGKRDEKMSMIEHTNSTPMYLTCTHDSASSANASSRSIPISLELMFFPSLAN